MLYKASAPANLMIMGEYAVVNGHPAIVCCVTPRLYISLKPRPDHQIHIQSELGKHTTDTKELTGESPFDLTIACLKQFSLPTGCDITITSEFSPNLGLGSSAALVAALCHTLSQWTEKDDSVNALWRSGIAAIRSLSEQASGADLAASLSGGVIIFKNSPLSIKNLYFPKKISVIYSGKKLETKEALLSHKKKKIESPHFISALEEVSSQLVKDFILAVQEKNWETAGQKLNAAHGLLHTLGVSNERLDTLTWLLRESDSIYGAKISGSGLGDCVIGLGQARNPILTPELIKLGCQQFSFEITANGVIRETN
jgi:mevalonate kinase